MDCGYSLEPPRRGGSNEYPQSMFRAKKMKNYRVFYLKIFNQSVHVKSGYALFMPPSPPTSRKLVGHIAFGSLVRLFVHLLVKQFIWSRTNRDRTLKFFMLTKQQENIPI